MHRFKAIIAIIAIIVAGGALYSVSTRPKDNEALIGIWRRQEQGAWDVIEFRRNGTFLHHDPFGTHSMRYNLTGKRLVTFQEWNATSVSRGMLFGFVPGRSVLILTNLNAWAHNEVDEYRRLNQRELRELDLDDFKGRQLVSLPATATPEEVVSALFKKAASPETKVGRYKIEKVFLDRLSSRGAWSLAWVDTDRGRRGVEFVFDRPQLGVETLRGWWCEVRDYGAVAQQAQIELKPAQPDGAANGSQPIRPETNSTSSAAGSRR